MLQTLLASSSVAEGTYALDCGTKNWQDTSDIRVQKVQADNMKYRDYTESASLVNRMWLSGKSRRPHRSPELQQLNPVIMMMLAEL